MKLIIRTLFIGLLTYALSIYLPWWTLLVVAFIAGFLIHGTGIGTFVSGFLGAGLVWIGYAWWLDFNSSSDFSNKLVELLPVKDSIFLIVGAGLIAGICGGLAAACGNSFKYFFVKKKTSSVYH